MSSSIYSMMRTKIIAIKRVFGILFLLPFWLNAQTITTIAGNGASTFSGNGVAATIAGIPNPGGGVFDKQGNYYFADGQNSHRIRKIDPSGIITTIAGNGMGGYFGDSGPATNARLNTPQSVVLDTLGNLYITDLQNNRIRKVDVSTGIITTIAGNGTGAYGLDGVAATSTSLWAPQDACVDKKGNIYIADANNARIRKVDLTGVITTFAGTGTAGFSGDNGPATLAQVALPVGLATDDTGNIYIADWSSFSNRVRKVDTFGVITTVVGNGGGTYTTDGIPATAATLVPLKIFLDKFNNIFIADRYNNRIYKVNSSTGIFYSIAGNGTVGDGGDSGPATSATLNYPSGVAVDACGNVYIPTVGSVSVSGSGRRIRKIVYSTTGIAGITISVLPNDTICAGTPVTYTATLTDSSTTGYQWYKNGVAISGATNRNYTYTPGETGDNIYCVYTGIDVCSFSDHPSSNVVHMVVTPLTAPTISLAGVTSASVGATVTVNATVSSAGGSYSIKWYKNSVLFNTTTVPTVTYTKAAGADVITAKVSSTDATGCYDTTTSAGHTITVAPNGVQTLVAIGEFSVYPNPAHNTIFVSASTGTLKTISISNLLGREVIYKECSAAAEEVSIGHLPVGVYIIRVNGEYVQRLVKE